MEKSQFNEMEKLKHRKSFALFALTLTSIQYHVKGKGDESLKQTLLNLNSLLYKMRIQAFSCREVKRWEAMVEIGIRGKLMPPEETR